MIPGSRVGRWLPLAGLIHLAHTLGVFGVRAQSGKAGRTQWTIVHRALAK